MNSPECYSSHDRKLKLAKPCGERLEKILSNWLKRTTSSSTALLGKFKRGKLVAQPDFQRQFVWDQVKASKPIESALLGIPIPIICLSEEPDNKEYVIDGQQRLTSFFSFIVIHSNRR